MKLVLPRSGVGDLPCDKHEKPFEILNSVTPGAQKGGNAVPLPLAPRADVRVKLISTDYWSTVLTKVS